MLEHSKEAKRLYNSVAWQRVRKAYIDTVDYKCEHCGDAGYIVHHKIHIDASNVNDPEVTLNFDNLEYLCVSCHNKTHYTENSETVEGVTFNEFGQLVKIES